jgi:hypothetical protein
MYFLEEKILFDESKSGWYTKDDDECYSLGSPGCNCNYMVLTSGSWGVTTDWKRYYQI